MHERELNELLLTYRRERDPEAIEALFDATAPQLLRLAMHLTDKAADAEDLLQDAVLRALRGFDTFEPGTNFRAWFFRILMNRFYSDYRKERRHQEDVELEDVPSVYLFRQSAALGLDRAGDPLATTLGRLETEQVREALDALPEEFRVVATLYFFDELRYEEIAQAVDVPIGTVRSRLHRARRLLQKRLWQVALDHGLVPTAVPPRGTQGA
jgi:RNA polymerase sigma-70 factor (ECF subfamily)